MTVEGTARLLDLLGKVSLSTMVAALLLVVLYLASEERLMEATGRHELIKMLIQECVVDRPQRGLSFDMLYELKELAELDRDLEYVEALVEEDEKNAASR